MSKEYTVVTRFVANTKDFMQGMQKAQKSTSDFSNKFSKSIDNTEKRTSRLGSAIKGAFTFTGKVAGAVGVFKAVDGAINMVTSSFDRAISRVDALNQFPKVLQQMGYGADEAEKATKKLTDGIDGLPTTLDGITGDVQRLVNVFQDVDLAAESAIGLNNAFLASGASQDEASRGLDQYIKMLSTGKVNMQSWQTLQETMPYALQETAEAFDFTGKSAQNDFYEALQSGEITMDEFNDKIIELSEKQGGFAEVAIEATKGISTSWGNIQTAIANGVAKSIQAFDDFLESKGLGGISGVLDNVKIVVGDTFNRVNEVVPVALEWFSKLYSKVSESKSWNTFKDLISSGVDAIQDLWTKFSESESSLGFVKDLFSDLLDIILDIDFTKLAEDVGSFIDRWTPLMAGIAGGIAAFKLITGAITLWTTVTGIAATVTGIAAGATTVFGAALAFVTSPIGIVVLAIGALIAIGTLLWKNWDTIKEKTIEIWGSIGTWFSEFWEKTKATFYNALEWINDKTDGKFFETVEIIFNYMQMAWDNIQEIWNFIKETFKNVLDFLKALVKGDFEGMKNAIQNQMENTKELLSNIWSNIKDFLSDTIGDIVQNAVSGFTKFLDKTKEIFGNIWTFITDTFSDIVTAATELPGKIGNGIGNMADKVTSGVKKVANKLAETLGKGVNGVVGGINWILDKIGVGDGDFIPKWDVPQFAKGGTHKGGLAILGDGGQNELFHTPDGKIGLSPDSDTLMNLPKGTSILSGEKTKKFFESIPMYKDGTSDGFFSKAWQGVKNVGSKIADWTGNVWDYIQNPSKLLDVALNAVGFNLPDGDGFIGNLTKSGLKYIKDFAIDFVKDKLTSFTDSAPNAGSGVQRWAGVAARALQMTGQFTQANLQRLLYQMQTESGGNPRAINLWDINAKRGTPSKGLMQVIDPTFRAYKMPGFNDIWNPLHNILASIRYTLSRYGSLLAGWRGVGYEKGGFVNQDQIARLGEGNKREAVIPLQNMRYMKPFSDAVAANLRKVMSFNPTDFINMVNNGLNQFTTDMAGAVQSTRSQLAVDSGATNNTTNNTYKYNIDVHIDKVEGGEKGADRFFGGIERRIKAKGGRLN